MNTSQESLLSRIKSIFPEADVCLKTIDEHTPWVVPHGGFIVLGDELFDIYNDDNTMTIGGNSLTLARFIDTYKSGSKYSSKKLKKNPELSLCRIFDEIHQLSYYARKDDKVEVSEEVTITFPYIYNIKCPTPQWTNKFFTISEIKPDKPDGILLYPIIAKCNFNKLSGYDKIEFYKKGKHYEPTKVTDDTVLAKLPYDIETLPNMTKLYYKTECVPVEIDV